MATIENCVERDGHCRTQQQAERPKFLWCYPSDVAKSIQQQQQGENQKIIVDVRSFALYCGKHIQTAINLSFSPILMRRLLKGVMSLDSLITDASLLTSIATADQVILYDTNSTPSNTRLELIKLIDMLQTRFNGSLNLKVLLGGMESFQVTFGDLCTSEQPGKVTSPTIITLDTSVINMSSSTATPEATPVEILPFLYLGSAKDSADLRVLRKMNITAVLNITTSCPNHFESYLEYKSIPVNDIETADLLSRLQTAITFIDEVKSKGGSVFVHCHAGISRSATVCIAYLMQKKHMTLSDAYKFVQSKRPIISPNLGFMGQLMIHQQNLQSLWSSSTKSSPQTSTTQTITTKNTSTFTRSLITSSNPLLISRGSAMDTLSSVPEYTTISQAGPPINSRSVSLPGGVMTRKKSREGLKLTLSDNHCSSTTGITKRQISPCRIEAVNRKDSLSLSLNLSTTCT